MTSPPERQPGNTARRDRESLAARLVDLSWRRAITVLMLVAIALAATVASVAGLRFRSEITDLAPGAVTEAIARLEAEFGVLDQLVLLFERGEASEAALLAFLDELETELAGAELVRDVDAGFRDLEALAHEPTMLVHAPFFSPAASLAELQASLEPEGLRATLRRQALRLALPGRPEEEVEFDPLDLRRFLSARLASGGERPEIHSAAGRYQSADRDSALVRVTGEVSSSDPAAVATIVNGVDAAIERARARVEGAASIRVRKAGGYALAAESEALMRRDLERNITFSVFIVILLLAVAWRRARLVILAAIPVVVGIGLGLGVFSIFRREIVVLALISGAVLAALGIDFVIHLIDPLVRTGQRVRRAALVESAGRSGRALAFAAFTTSAAFLSISLLSGGFLLDLGLLTACGIGACWLCALVVLPAVLSVAERVRPTRAGPEVDPGSSTAVEPPLRRSRAPGSSAAVACLEFAWSRPRRVLGGVLLLTLAAVARLVHSPPEVETDLRKLHAQDTAALLAEAAIHERFRTAADPVLLRVALTDVPAVSREGEELQLHDALARLDAELRSLVDAGRIAGWSSASRFVPAPFEQAAVREILAQRPIDERLELLRVALEEEGFDPAAFRPAVERFRRALELDEPLRLSTLPFPALARRVAPMLSRKGSRPSALVVVDAGAGLWERVERRALLEELTRAAGRVGLDAEAGGLHAASSAASRFVVTHFLEASALALGVVVIAVVGLLRRPRTSLAALLPVLLGCVWTLALWSLCGERLHLMNVGILPMILGIGVDDGLHLVAHATRRGVDPRRAMRETVPAVLLTTWTTLAAFGTLAFSASPGLASVGRLCSFGLATALLASLLALPAALAWRSPAAGSSSTDDG